MDRGIAIARATGAGRLLVPMMLVKGYPLEIQGRLAEALELCEEAVESARLSANPHYQFWALFELGWAHYYRGDLDAALDVLEESGRVGGLLAGATMPAGSGGPGWPLAATLFELGEVERGFEVMRAIGGDELVHAIPVESCFYWEILALAELRRGQPDAAARTWRAPRPTPRRSTSGCPRRWPARAPGRAHAGERGRWRARRRPPGSRWRRARPSARCCRRRTRAACAVRRWPRPGDRKGAIEELREAESELDRCGSVRVRDEAAARATQARGPGGDARPGHGRGLRGRAR